MFSPQFQYVVVIMTENVDPMGSPAYIRELSKAIYSFFEHQSAGAAQGTVAGAPPAEAPARP